MPLPPVSLRQASPRSSDSSSAAVKVPDELFHQRRGVVGHSEENGPQPAFPDLIDHPVLVRGGLGRRLTLEHLGQHLARLLVGQRAHKGVHLLRGLRLGGNGHLLRLLLGLWRLGFRYLLRLRYSSQGDDGHDEQEESCRLGRSSHRCLLLFTVKAR